MSDTGEREPSGAVGTLTVAPDGQYLDVVTEMKEEATWSASPFESGGLQVSLKF